jgi:hypothetical protein
LVSFSVKTPGLNAKPLEASGGDTCVVNGMLGISMPKVILDQPQVASGSSLKIGRFDSTVSVRRRKYSATYPQYSKNRRKDRSAVVAYCVLGRS